MKMSEYRRERVGSLECVYTAFTVQELVFGWYNVWDQLNMRARGASALKFYDVSYGQAVILSALFTKIVLGVPAACHYDPESQTFSCSPGATLRAIRSNAVFAQAAQEFLVGGCAVPVDLFAAEETQEISFEVQ